MTTSPALRPQPRFEHVALFYEGLNAYTSAMIPFIQEGLDAGEPVLVIVPGDRLAALRSALGPAADRVELEDMAEIGRNPGAIISRWRDFAASHPSRRVRGIGEPIWASRTAEELVECQRHEALINLAFVDVDGAILCPYDTTSLPQDVLEEASRTHPTLLKDGRSTASLAYAGLGAIGLPFGEPLSEPPSDIPVLTFDVTNLGGLRELIGRHAQSFGMEPDRVESLVLAVNELATNSIRHGGGAGTLRLWEAGDDLLCEVRDAGRLSDALAGRHRPPVGDDHGYGLWMVNQLCDLVQARVTDDGVVTRVRMRRA